MLGMFTRSHSQSKCVLHCYLTSEMSGILLHLVFEAQSHCKMGKSVLDFPVTSLCLYS